MMPPTKNNSSKSDDKTEQVRYREVEVLPINARLALTIRDAARALGCGRTLLCELLASGAIPAKKLGSKRTVILRSDLEAYLQSLPSIDPSKDVIHG